MANTTSFSAIVEESANVVELDEADDINTVPDRLEDTIRSHNKTPHPPDPPAISPPPQGDGPATPQQQSKSTTRPGRSTSKSKSPTTTPKPPGPSRGSSKSSRTKKSKSKSSRKRGISFKKTVGVHTIPNLSTYSVVEKELSWFAPDEYGEMEDECDLTAEILDRKKPLWPGQCARGLESWTMEGEQRKEGHVQLAIDIVWQAQLEQWKASTDFHACWEYIRERYLAVSQPCHKVAHDRGLADEKEVKAYLAGVRSVEKNRQRLLGISHKDRKIRRDDPFDAPTPKSGRQKLGAGSEQSIDASVSDRGRIKGVLKVSSADDLSKSSNHSKKSSTKSSSNASVTSASLLDDAISTTSSKRSTASRKKVSYQPKSRSKVPVSPVASLVGDDSDDDSTSRRMRSHMSVTSEDSTRRRMLRTASIKPL